MGYAITARFLICSAAWIMKNNASFQLKKQVAKKGFILDLHSEIDILVA